MKQVIQFLRDIAAHNEREWFLEHKEDYLTAKNSVNKLAGELITEISKFDSSVSSLKPENCTYRIYRDQRFHKELGPYKDHMGIYINKGGKKSGYSGYYIHISANTSDEMPSVTNYNMSHMIAAGDYCCDSNVLKILREDIEMGDGEFEKIIHGLHPLLHLDTSNALKNVPRDFPKDSPHAEYLKLKNFALCASLDDKFITAPQLAKRLAQIFKSAKPFLDFVNRAIDYAREYPD